MKKNNVEFVLIHDVEDIAKSIDYLIENPEIAKKMGENGYKAVIEKYNWTTEEARLLELYSIILDDNDR